jgi:flagellar hook-basal body complex protein FliE
MSITLSSASSAYNKANNLNTNSTTMANPTESFKSALNSFDNMLVNSENLYNQNNLVTNVNDNNKFTQNANRLSSLFGQTSKNVYDLLKTSEHVTSQAVVDEASVNDVVTTITEAEIALHSIMAIRDKVIAAYNDVIKMAI